MKDMKLPGFPKSAEDEFKTQPATGTKEQKSMMDRLFGSVFSVLTDVAGAAKSVAGSIGSTFESVINYADHGIYEDDAAMRSRKVAALEDKISGLMDGFRTDKRDVTDAKLSEAMAMADELGIDASGLGKEIAAKRSALAAELASRPAASDTGAGGSSSTAPMSYTDALVASGAVNGVDQMVTYDYKAVQQPGLVESLLFTQMYAGEGPTVTVGDTIGSQTANLSYTQAIEKGGGYSLNAATYEYHSDGSEAYIETVRAVENVNFVSYGFSVGLPIISLGSYTFGLPSFENTTIMNLDNPVDQYNDSYLINRFDDNSMAFGGSTGGLSFHIGWSEEMSGLTNSLNMAKKSWPGVFRNQGWILFDTYSSNDWEGFSVSIGGFNTKNAKNTIGNLLGNSKILNNGIAGQYHTDYSKPLRDEYNIGVNLPIYLRDKYRDINNNMSQRRTEAAESRKTFSKEFNQLWKNPNKYFQSYFTGRY